MKDESVPNMGLQAQCKYRVSATQSPIDVEAILIVSGTCRYCVVFCVVQSCTFSKVQFWGVPEKQVVDWEEVRDMEYFPCYASGNGLEDGVGDFMTGVECKGGTHKSARWWLRKNRSASPGMGETFPRLQLGVIGELALAVPSSVAIVICNKTSMSNNASLQKLVSRQKSNGIYQDKAKKLIEGASDKNSFI
ncbi:hypothetical protein C5167_029313 [Papaver somniferum]|nr:hypothetical protein C5167_029313 [Papaver somniferum]